MYHKNPILLKMSQSVLSRGISHVHQAQINRLQEVLASLQQIRRHSYLKYRVLNCLMVIINFLTALSGAGFMAQSAYDESWGRGVNFILSCLPILQGFAKMLSLEDQKNAALRYVKISTNLVTKLTGCLAKIRDLMNDDELTPAELATWDKIVRYIAHVESISLRASLGEEIKPQTLTSDLDRQLQKDGIMGISGGLG